MQTSGIGIVFSELSGNVNYEVLVSELSFLLGQWNYIIKKTIYSNPLDLIFRECDIISNLVRDFHLQNLDFIHTDHSLNLHKINFFLNYWQYSEKSIPTKFYLYANKKQLIKKQKMHQAWLNLYNQKVDLLTGGYIIIDSFNAMTIIDVNSGGFNTSLKVQDTVLQINLIAAKEIARQLLARNISGIILIDFIDMSSLRDKLLLLEYLYLLLAEDYAKPQIVQFSELGLIEITRKRVNQNLNLNYLYQQFDRLYIHFNLVKLQFFLLAYTKNPSCFDFIILLYYSPTILFNQNYILGYKSLYRKQYPVIV
jgi:Rne/Rng family ribonuclease